MPQTKTSLLTQRSVLSWALYDWANSAFATTVMALFFPIFFKQYWSQGVDPSTSTYHLGIANSVSSLCLALLAPLLGAISDQGARRKSFLAFFAIAGILATAGLSQIQSGEWQLAIFVYIVASLGWAGANIFYDSLIVRVCKPHQTDLVSGYGFSLGYLGGGILLLLNAAMTLKPEFFGFADKTEAVQFSFLTVTIWWLIFSLPLLAFVRERKNLEEVEEAVEKGLKVYWQTLKRITQFKPLLTFLFAYLLYIEGVNTIIKMAVDFGLALGLSDGDMVKALLIVQFVAFPAALGFGYLGHKIGAKSGILIGLGIYIGVSLGALFIDQVWEFYAMAAAIGLVQGGVQALSRSFYARMIPEKKSGEYFGFFNMWGKFSAILGPFIVGWVSVTTGSPRMSIAAVLVFFILGGALLLKSDPDYRVPD